jgi:hypothetical protein
MLAKDPAERPAPDELSALLRQVAHAPEAQTAAAPVPAQVRTGATTVAVAPASPAAIADALEPPLAARALAWAVLCLVMFVAAAGVTTFLR